MSTFPKATTNSSFNLDDTQQLICDYREENFLKLDDDNNYIGCQKYSNGKDLYKVIISGKEPNFRRAYVYKTNPGKIISSLEYIMENFSTLLELYVM